MTSQTIRIVNGGLEAESVAAIESAAGSISRMYKVEVVDLKDAFVVDAGDSRRRFDIQLVVWVICIPRGFSVCQVQSILSRFEEQDCGLLVIAPDVAPLQTAFSRRPVRFLRLPARCSEIVEALQRVVLECQRTDSTRIVRQFGQQTLIGQSPAILGMTRVLRRIAPHDVPVLLQGETGTGKEVVTRAIHYLSARRDAPFVPFQCGGVPVDLLENELFGHGAGAYTGAISDQHGTVESAEGGTLFLDEIDTLQPLAQVKILRFLQEREYKPLGTSQVRKANIRILAACNVNLRAAADEEKFRKDLFYRLSTVTIELPPLRERREDIPLLARYFLRSYADRYGRQITGFAPDVLPLLCSHSWEGNIRELESTIHRAVLMAETEYIEESDIDLPISKQPLGDLTFSGAKRRAIEKFEKEYLEKILNMSDGNVVQAARVAGKDPRVLRALMQKHRIEHHRYRQENDDSGDCEAQRAAHEETERIFR